MASETFAHVIGRLEADPVFRLALEADPWLALACYDRIRDGREPQVVSVGPSGVAGEARRRRRPSGTRQDRAAA